MMELARLRIMGRAWRNIGRKGEYGYGNKGSSNPKAEKGSCPGAAEEPGQD